MARTKKVRQEGDRLTDLMNIGVLTTRFPLEVVREVLKETGRESQRERALPAHVLTYYVIALGLFRPQDTREVLRVLQEGLKVIFGERREIRTAGKSAISQARSRLGMEPMKQLYERVVKPVATEQTRGAFYRDWRMVALDGFTLEVPDTEANRAAFARPESPSGGEAAYPRLRGVGLVEVGTHVLFGAALDSYAKGEITLAREVVPHLRPGMLCLADRYFPGYALWEQAVKTGAQLVWRVREKIRFPVEELLPDGSYLSRFYPKWNRGKPQGEGIPVRVLEYEVLGSEERVRLVTSILDWRAAPAAELAALYHERWEFETALDEFKTHLRGARTVLRSQTPDLVRQEVYGVLLAHFALRGLMHEAALKAGRDPDRISFTHTVNVVRRTLPRFAALPPSGLAKGARGRGAGDPGGRRRRKAAPDSQARGEAKAKPVSSPAAN
jgi:Insertion element 4 transposase N-terminal/Transposase DDE domain